MENFRSVLSDCNLFDVGVKGPVWTYNNKQEGLKNVRAWLDRGVASPGWLDYYKEVGWNISIHHDQITFLSCCGWEAEENGDRLMRDRQTYSGMNICGNDRTHSKALSRTLGERKARPGTFRR